MLAECSALKRELERVVPLDASDELLSREPKVFATTDVMEQIVWCVEMKVSGVFFKIKFNFFWIL